MRKIFFLLAILFSGMCLRAQNPFRITFGPYLQNVTADGATVIWGTSADALSWVEVAPDDDNHFYAEERPQFFETVLGKRTVGRLHTVRVTGLSPATAYRYRVCSKEVMEQSPYLVRYGQTICSDVYRRKPYCFRTPDADRKTTSFVMVNDVHENSEMLAALLGDVKKENCDFVFFNGDMVNNMSGEQQLVDGFLAKSTELFAAEIPFFFARGNHETRGLFSDRYLDYFPTSTGQPYYSFREGPVFFIVMDGGEDKPDSDIEYYGLADFDRYRADQVAWIRRTVASEEFRSAPFRVAVIHVPPVGGTWHGTLELRKHFVPVLNEAGIDLMLCGHLHKHRYIAAGEEGCDFPVLINAQGHALDVQATESEMVLKIRDTEKRPVKEIVLKAGERK